jgi:hypothetical protein
MRRRMIDPAFWSDSKIIELSIPARLLYIGLWNYADDDGFFLDDLPAIKRILFPDQKFDIHGAFSECSCFLKKHQYKDDEHFAWQISHFCDWQTINRPTPSKIKPFCKLTEDSLNTHGALTPKLSKDKLREVKKREVKIGYPTDFAVDQTTTDLAVKNGWPDPITELVAFRDYHVARGSRFLDWGAAFRTWLRNAKRFGGNGRGGNGKQQAEGELSDRTLRILRRGL